MSKVKEDLKEIYEYQTDSDYVKENLTDIITMNWDWRQVEKK